MPISIWEFAKSIIEELPWVVRLIAITAVVLEIHDLVSYHKKRKITKEIAPILPIVVGADFGYEHHILRSVLRGLQQEIHLSLVDKTISYSPEEDSSSRYTPHSPIS